MRWLRWIVGWVFLLGVISGLGWIGYVYYQHTGEEMELRFEKVEKGKLTVFLESTGTVQPEEVIDVGAQVAGKVVEFGDDPHDPNKRIDYGTKVEKGTILAVLDAELFRSRLRLADSALQRCRADLRVLEAKQRQAEREWERVRGLAGTRTVSDQEVDLARSTYEISLAETLRGKAAEAEALATRTEAETNLNYTVIKSPVKGIIIDRRVNVGQTVVASLNAPSLFLIATDLTRMQVWVSVNEADIGQIRVGQPVLFTVDARSNELFRGTVSQVRLNARMEQNVVSYIVVVDTSNSDMRLLPYLTANLKFLVHEREDALLVPNAALRYKPSPDRVDPRHHAVDDPPKAEPVKKSEGDRKAPPTDGSKGKGPESGKAKATAPRPEKRIPVFGTVWTTNSGGLLEPVKVRIGITDGKHTEILEVLEGTLPPGAEVATGEVRVAESAEGVNPFAPPKIFGRRSKSSGSKK